MGATSRAVLAGGPLSSPRILEVRRGTPVVYVPEDLPQARFEHVGKHAAPERMEMMPYVHCYELRRIRNGYGDEYDAYVHNCHGAQRCRYMDVAHDGLTERDCAQFVAMLERAARPIRAAE